MVSEPAVFALGTINADVVLRVDAPLERGASLLASGMLRTSGGRAGNAAVMACRLGAPARLFGCVGADELAEQALAGPRSAGVEVSGVRRVAGDSGLAVIVVGEAGKKTMIFAAGANDTFSEADGERVAVTLRDAARRSVLVVDGELPPAGSARALQAAKANGLPVVLDPTRPDRVTDRLLAMSDHVMPNADEAARMTGIDIESPADAHRAARRLRRRGARIVHVRLAGGGCLTLSPDGEALVSPPEDVDVVDTTGAGDAFAGTLATAIIARVPTVDAVRLAVAAAAIAAAGFGPQESYPDRTRLYAAARGVRVSRGDQLKVG